MVAFVLAAVDLKMKHLNNNIPGDNNTFQFPLIQLTLDILSSGMKFLDKNKLFGERINKG